MKKAQSPGPSIQGATSSASQDIKEDMIVLPESLVANVKDLFPQLSEGFLVQCFPYFDNNPEKVINALLEDNLPPHLASLDR